MDEKLKQTYRGILREELKKATGCTEPIAVAYCAAVLRKIFDGEPNRIIARLSGNMIKNVKSVVVPNTSGHRGIAVAIATGFVAGNADAQLQVIAKITPEQQVHIYSFLEHTDITIQHRDTPCTLDIELEAESEECNAVVRIANYHTNVVLIRKNSEDLFCRKVEAYSNDGLQDRSGLTVEKIFQFVQEEPLDSLKDMLREQISCNVAIAEEGLRGKWGAQIGRTLLERQGIETEACAYAAAGSDARMSGCEMPVVILSGSGNQGITASVPVLRYGKYLKATEEAIYRALALSDLITLQIKEGIGRLSAFCGAVCAGIGAGAGIAYLHEPSLKAVSQTVSNACGILAGTICDGAKPSCASKIAESVSAGILAFQMYQHGTCFRGGDGIIGSDLEMTIDSIGKVGRFGMAETDKVILEIMNQTV